MKLISSFIFPVKLWLFLSKVVNRHSVFTAVSSLRSNNNIYKICFNVSITVLWFLTTDIDFD